jgi:two-component system, NarL family, response regulator
MTRIRILVVDDHPMMRDGIASAVGAQRDMEVVGEASDGRKAIDKFRMLRPDVTLLDLDMPEMNGLEALQRIRAEFADARVVVLTTYKGDVLATRALKAGALGYLLKSSLRTDMMGAIRAANEGRRYVPAEVAVAIAEHVGTEDLSRREVEILRHIAAGLSNKEIAIRLGVSDETVKTHLKSAFSKLNVSDRSHAVATAMERGIFQLPSR